MKHSIQYLFRHIIKFPSPPSTRESSPVCPLRLFVKRGKHGSMERNCNWIGIGTPHRTNRYRNKYNTIIISPEEPQLLTDSSSLDFGEMCLVWSLTLLLMLSVITIIAQGLPEKIQSIVQIQMKILSVLLVCFLSHTLDPRKRWRKGLTCIDSTKICGYTSKCFRKGFLSIELRDIFQELVEFSWSLAFNAPLDERSDKDRKYSICNYVCRTSRV